MSNENESEGLGIASMVIGIFGSWIPFLGIPVFVLGLILGLLQKNWTKKGIAITGVTINVVWIFLFISGMIVGV